MCIIKQTQEKAKSLLKDLAKSFGEAEQLAVELQLLSCDATLVQQLQSIAVNMKAQYTVMHPLLGHTPDTLQPYIECGKSLVEWFKERKDYANAYLNVEKRKQKKASMLVPAAPC